MSQKTHGSVIHEHLNLHQQITGKPDIIRTARKTSRSNVLKPPFPKTQLDMCAKKPNIVTFIQK